MHISKIKDIDVDPDKDSKKPINLNAKKFSLVLLIFIMIGFGFCFKPIHTLVGNGAFIIMNAFPVAAGLLFGLRAGLMFGFITIGYVIFLGSTIFIDIKAFMPMITVSGTIMVILGTGVGRLRDLSIGINRELQKRLEVEEELKKYQKELELRVKERTMDLKQANVDLQDEINERKKAEEEKKELETRLTRSQKMEAIGVLAGGVAHDLNNILSGIVSYPELLLMNMPENDPLREPIQSMQKSGKKAAAIVQDLLTLSRRGLIVSEIVDLNMVIGEYIAGSDFGNLRLFHPDVSIKTALENKLLNILGSPVHIYKTVMNLVSNAAEALPDGGEIRIATEKRYINMPIKGYDNVVEGEYITLMVSDNGSGISSEDIENIFEPFFSKKKMGRSGTGLGMSVVWGTIKDHKGYIQVDSTIEKGTTITLYFPVTMQNKKEDNTIIPIDNYMGNGESVLVVDDMKDQLVLASAMLKRLGYLVTIVSSGEEAIEYLKNNTVEIIVLDMIMDPGIDGLETYREILKFHPDQKAIIASGYAKADRIIEAQSIGAGQYVKKPYTLEVIGTAIKHELEK